MPQKHIISSSTPEQWKSYTCALWGIIARVFTNYCQGFHDANFVYILISFMFSSCVDILSIGSSVLLKNPGRNDLASWFACLLKLHTMIHAFLGCISRCNHDFHFDIDRSKGTGTKMGCVVVTLKRKQLCTNQLYFLNTLPQKYHEFVQCWIFHWTQTWQTKYIPWVLCNNSFWTPNNLHIYFLGQQTCLRPVMACILQHRQCAHQNLSIGLIQHDISGCFFFNRWLFGQARFKQCFSSTCLCRVLPGTKSASNREPGGSLIFEPTLLSLFTACVSLPQRFPI